MGRIPSKIREAVLLTALYGQEVVERALAVAAEAGRFGDGDLVSISGHLHHGRSDQEQPVRADENFSVQPGTGAWEGFGR